MPGHRPLRKGAAMASAVSSRENYKEADIRKITRLESAISSGRQDEKTVSGLGGLFTVQEADKKPTGGASFFHLLWL